MCMERSEEEGRERERERDGYWEELKGGIEAREERGRVVVIEDLNPRVGVVKWRVRREIWSVMDE